MSPYPKSGSGGGAHGDEVRERRKARAAALQMLYLHEVAGLGPDEAIAAHAEIEQPNRPTAPETVELAARLVVGTVRSLAEVDPLIEAAADHWRLARLAVVDRLVLRLGTYELLHARETPPPVVINEAVELARTFGGEDSSRFVNGVLDAVRRRMASGGDDPGVTPGAIRPSDAGTQNPELGTRDPEPGT